RYCVLKVKLEDGSTITATGFFDKVTPGQELELEGKWTVHKQYGKQLAVEKCSFIQPLTLIGIEKYLGSGLIKGIGPAIAKRIVTYFGDTTMQVLEEAPSRLSEVEGIGQKKLSSISSALQDQKEVRRVMVFLQGHGVSPGYAARIYRRYRGETESILRKNPYRAADDVLGIGFRIADILANGLGFGSDHPHRLAAGIRFVLKQAEEQGHVFLPHSELIERSKETLQVEGEVVAPIISYLIENRALVNIVVEQENRVYRRDMFVSEQNVAKKLKQLAHIQSAYISDNFDRELDGMERAQNITYAPEQRVAIAQSLQQGVTIITGGPGTGKTTLIKALMKMGEMRNWAMALAAPTGRAAKRMSEATGKDAKTIHRLLEYTVQSGMGTFQRNQENPLRCDLVILDEVSMVDLQLMEYLLMAIPHGCRLVLVGDA
ncbi:MAG: helix-hairpin-helix domain-containing protein, partial [bacterium]|nr:helix-hairpin-helix domain-containing protein [bacterium]